MTVYVCVCCGGSGFGVGVVARVSQFIVVPQWINADNIQTQDTILKQIMLAQSNMQHSAWLDKIYAQRNLHNWK